MIPPLVTWAFIGVALYLLPLATVLVWRRPTLPAAAKLLDGGTALAIDALAVMCVARFVPLGVAVWIVRALWMVLFVVALARGRTVPRPAPLALGLALTCGALVVVGFHRMSYDLALWDRDWHIPLVSALRVQRAPFENVFLPRAPLRYHFLGDVIAAMIQSLSRDRIHASLALSLAHDVFLTLLAVVVGGACVLARVGTWRPRGGRAIAAALAGLGIGLAGAWGALFASPFVLTHAPLDELRTTLDSGLLCGHSYLAFPSIAYRPHVVVGAFFIAQAFIALVTGARREQGASEALHCTGALLAAGSALALLDEASHALLAAALAATALVVPGALARRWFPGLAVAAAFAALLLLVSAGLGGSLAIGGATSRVEFVPARHLALFDGSVPLTDREAFSRIFWRDYLPQLAGAALALLAALWTRRREVFAAAIFFTVLVVLSTAAALRVEVNKSPDEGHRFVSAAMLLGPVVAAWIIAAARGAWLPRLALVGVIAASGYSGWLWRGAFLRHRFIAEHAPSERRWAGTFNPNEIDCLRVVGPMRRTAPPPVEYLERDAAWVWSGCHPVRLLGGASKWNLAVHGIRFGFAASAGYLAEGPETFPDAVVCGTNPVAWSESVCHWARASLRCVPWGNAFTRCALAPGDREAFTSRLY